MAKNEILPFALGAGANVAPQSGWETEISRSTGFQAGTAKSAHLNKVWRQSAFVSHVLAQIIVDATNSDVLDNGNIETLKSRMRAAIYALGGSGALSDELATYKRVVDGLFASTNGNIGRVDNALAAAINRIAFLEARQNGRMVGYSSYGAPGNFVHVFNSECNMFRFGLVGGGGAGAGVGVPAGGRASVGSGGGSGGLTTGIYYNRKVRIGASINISVGAGGAALVGQSGAPGGTTSLATLAHAFGGQGGGGLFNVERGCGFNGPGAAQGSIYSEAGFGGGVVVNCGNAGSSGIILSGSDAFGGQGGSGPYGGAGGAMGQGSGGAPALCYGGGGGGACLLAGQGPAQGGQGGNGFVWIEEYT